jgi:hypothetical protein
MNNNPCMYRLKDIPLTRPLGERGDYPLWTIEFVSVSISAPNRPQYVIQKNLDI